MDFAPVRLPFLHPEPGAEHSQAKYLWPGLPDCESSAFWRPGGYPWTEREALAIFHDFRKLGLAELENMHHAATGPGMADELGRQDELAALAEFNGGRAEVSTLETLRRQAHKTLIWIWQLEEKIDEIAALECACGQAESFLKNCFLETAQPVSETGAARMENLLPWRACVASAAFFIPPVMPVLPEGPLKAAVMELAGAERGMQAGFMRVSAPLWRVLGYTRPVADSRLADIYNSERVWLAG